MPAALQRTFRGALAGTVIGTCATTKATRTKATKPMQPFCPKAVLLICILLAGAALTRDSRAEELTDERFEQLRTELRPSPRERWRTIPWRIALLDAQRTAAEQHKPIFIWAMDGHPLGCT